MQTFPAKPLFARVFAKWRLLPAATLLLLCLPVLLPSGARSQNADNLADVHAAIRRYGCDLPHNDSAATCRELHAQARAFAAQEERKPGKRYRRVAPSVAPWDAPPSSYGSPYGSSRSFIDTLFGDERDALEPRYSDPDHMYSDQMTPYGEQGYTDNYDDAYGDAHSVPQRSEPTYRTMCVRLCDGYYWPISFATVSDRFNADAQQCQSSCDAPAKLYVHRDPSVNIGQMTDLDGEPYSALPAAFRYRKKYVSDCRCKPEPWSAAAKAEYGRRERESPEPVIDETPAPRPPDVAQKAWRAPPEKAFAQPRYWPPHRPRSLYDSHQRYHPGEYRAWRGAIDFLDRSTPRFP